MKTETGAIVCSFRFLRYAMRDRQEAARQPENHDAVAKQTWFSGCLFFGARMKFVHHLFEPFIGNVGVDLRGGNIGMPK